MGLGFILHEEEVEDGGSRTRQLERELEVNPGQAGEGHGDCLACRQAWF